MCALSLVDFRKNGLAQQLGQISSCPENSSIPQPITIPASGPDGFDISVVYEPDTVRVSFGGLEQDFENADDAMVWINRAMSRSYRLRIDFVGLRPYCWQLEKVGDAGPPHVCLASGFAVMFWAFRRRKTIYRQNR